MKVVKSAPKGRYKGIKRNYEVEDLLKLRGSIDIEFVRATGIGKIKYLQIHAGHSGSQQAVAAVAHRAIHCRTGGS